MWQSTVSQPPSGWSTRVGWPRQIQLRVRKKGKRGVFWGHVLILRRWSRWITMLVWNSSDFNGNRRDAMDRDEYHADSANFQRSLQYSKERKNIRKAIFLGNRTTFCPAPNPFVCPPQRQKSMCSFISRSIGHGRLWVGIWNLGKVISIQRAGASVQSIIKWLVVPKSRVHDWISRQTLVEMQPRWQE